MKKLITFISAVIFLLSISSTVFAEKKEWIDKNYDFSKTKKILVIFRTPDSLKDGITDKEVQELFFEKLRRDVAKDLLPQNVKFYELPDIFAQMKLYDGIDISSAYNNDPQTAMQMINAYIEKNIDLHFYVSPLAYDVGSQYREGYFQTLPTQQTSFVNTPYGTNTVTTYGTEQKYIPGGNIPVVYACVRFDLFDIKTKQSVWSRIDDRARGNPTIFDNTKPKDLYGRIVSSYLNDLKDKLEKSQYKNK